MIALFGVEHHERAHIAQAELPAGDVQALARSRLSDLICAQRVGIQRLLEKLQSAGALAPDEADALQLEILIEQDDQRQAGPALPNLLPVPARSK